MSDLLRKLLASPWTPEHVVTEEEKRIRRELGPMEFRRQFVTGNFVDPKGPPPPGEPGPNIIASPDCTPRGLAVKCAEIEAAHGFQATSWENFLSKAMLVVTELKEAVDWVHGKPGESLKVEIADAAIRLLCMIHTLSGGDWADGRTKGRHRGIRDPETQHCFAPVEVLVWPVVDRLAEAAEYWRKGERSYVLISLELAIKETWLLSDRIGFDLNTEILRKMAINEARPHLHGKKENV